MTNKPHIHVVAAVFAEVESGELTLLEHEAARWLPADDLMQVKWLPADVLVVRALEKRQIEEWKNQ